MLLMFELGIRGEITQAVHRYAKASNKHTSDSEGSSFQQYFGRERFIWLGYVPKAPNWRILLG